MPYAKIIGACSALPGLIGSGCQWLRHRIAPTLGAVWLNTIALMSLLSVGTVLWWMVEPSPVKLVAVTGVDPQDRTVDRSRMETIGIERRVVMSRTSDVRIVRMWVDEGRGVQPTLDDWLHFEEGDKIRPTIRVPVPTALGEGRHLYRVYVEWCNPLRCVKTYQPDVEFLVVGRPPVRPLPGAQRD